jgi:hypothetical protein
VMTTRELRPPLLAMTMLVDSESLFVVLNCSVVKLTLSKLPFVADLSPSGAGTFLFDFHFQDFMPLCLG